MKTSDTGNGEGRGDADERDRRFARRLTRNVLLGIVAMYGVSLALCLPGGLSLGLAAGVALLPAVFAGPFVGGLVTMVTTVVAGEPGAAATEGTVAPKVTPARFAAALPDQI